jgi:hypothetical protein
MSYNGYFISKYYYIGGILYSPIGYFRDIRYFVANATM